LARFQLTRRIARSLGDSGASCSSSSPSHFLFPRDFSGTIADTAVINTPPEPSRPTDVPFVGYKTESKDLGGVLAARSISAYSGAIWRMKKNKCRLLATGAIFKTSPDFSISSS